VVDAKGFETGVRHGLGGARRIIITIIGESPSGSRERLPGTWKKITVLSAVIFFSCIFFNSWYDVEKVIRLPVSLTSQEEVL